MSNLKGKVVLITGAGRGLGAHLAHAFSEHGACVATFDREISEKSLGGNAIAYQGDVTNATDVAGCFQAVKEQFGTIHILITCAGIFSPSAVVQNVTNSDWDRVLRINLTGTFLFVKRVIPLMLENGWGRVICLASTAGVAHPPGNAPYNASKAGVISLVRTVSQEIDVENVCINAVCPGNTDTPMTQSIELSAGTGKAGDRAAYHRNLREQGLYHQPEDVMDLISYLASEESRYISGQFIQLTPTRFRR